MSVLTVRSLPAPEVSMREILRYARSAADDTETVRLALDCLDEVLPTLSYRAVYTVEDVTVTGEVCDIGGIRIRSAALAKNLSGVSRAVLVCATVGLGPDRLVMKYSRSRPVRALIMQAIGAERVEAVLDALTEELNGEYGALRPRFSVGYGDAPLESQREITERLETAKRIGVSLSESMIMTPTKSVSAIIGIDK